MLRIESRMPEAGNGRVKALRQVLKAGIAERMQSETLLPKSHTFVWAAKASSWTPADVRTSGGAPGRNRTSTPCGT
jgi:hypothetical protein